MNVQAVWGAPTHGAYGLLLTAREGEEIVDDVDLALLERDSLVYVSMGEAFRPVLHQERAGPSPQLAAATLTARDQRAPPQTAVPRVLAFKNGAWQGGSFLLARSLEQLLDTCQTRWVTGASDAARRVLWSALCPGFPQADAMVAVATRCFPHVLALAPWI